MKNFTITTLLISFLMITLISCEKDEGICPSTEKQIQGQWEFEKVTFQKNLTLSFDNITDDYKGISIEFLDDNSFTQTNSILGQNSKGNWNISGDYMHYGESGQYIEKLECSSIETSNGELNDFEWNNLNVTKKKITCSNQTDGGYYRYTLVKL